MDIEHHWLYFGEEKESRGKNLLSCKFFHRKSDMGKLWIEVKLSLLEIGD
jgi:hypothetical protein